MLDAIKWYGHASFGIDGPPRILIDPFSILYEGETPDIILVTHEHYDHCSPADVNKLAGPNTRIIASRTAAAQLYRDDVVILRPWQVINFGRTSIKAVPAYTYTDDHPAHREDLGFVISINHTDIYYAGDTSFIPELRNMRCDIAILPVSSREGLMASQGAVEFVESVHPRFVIPSHIGSKPESARRLDVQAFERGLHGLVDVVQLPLAHQAGSRSVFA